MLLSIKSSIFIFNIVIFSSTINGINRLQAKIFSKALLLWLIWWRYQTMMWV